MRDARSSVKHLSSSLPLCRVHGQSCKITRASKADTTRLIVLVIETSLFENLRYHRAFEICRIVPHRLKFCVTSAKELASSLGGLQSSNALPSLCQASDRVISKGNQTSGYDDICQICLLLIANICVGYTHRARRTPASS